MKLKNCEDSLTGYLLSWLDCPADSQGIAAMAGIGLDKMMNQGGKEEMVYVIPWRWGQRARVTIVSHRAGEALPASPAEDSLLTVSIFTPPVCHSVPTANELPISNSFG